MAPDKNLELSVVLVGEDRIREMNRAYLDRDDTTDVLAFPMMSPDEIEESRSSEHPEPLGDIAICMPVAEAHASEMGHGEWEEVELLAVHGLLHLLGYDDEDIGEARKMAEMEKRLIGRSMYTNGLGD